MATIEIQSTAEGEAATSMLRAVHSEIGQAHEFLRAFWYEAQDARKLSATSTSTSAKLDELLQGQKDGRASLETLPTTVKMKELLSMAAPASPKLEDLLQDQKATLACLETMPTTAKMSELLAVASPTSSKLDEMVQNQKQIRNALRPLEKLPTEMTQLVKDEVEASRQDLAHRIRGGVQALDLAVDNAQTSIQQDVQALDHAIGRPDTPIADEMRNMNDSLEDLRAQVADMSQPTAQATPPDSTMTSSGSIQPQNKPRTLARDFPASRPVAQTPQRRTYAEMSSSSFQGGLSRKRLRPEDGLQHPRAPESEEEEDSAGSSSALGLRTIGNERGIVLLPTPTPKAVADYSMDELMQVLDAFHPTKYRERIAATELPEAVLNAIRPQLEHFLKKSVYDSAIKHKTTGKIACGRKKGARAAGPSFASENDRCPECAPLGLVCVRRSPSNETRPLLVPVQRTSMAGEREWADPAMWTGARL